MCALLLALGVLVLTDALTMDVDITQRGPVGPKTMPVVVGIGLLVIAALLAVDVLRGGRGEAEGGEDIDLSEPADWRTVLLLSGIFLGAAALIEPAGFPGLPVRCSSGAPPSRSAVAAWTAIRSIAAVLSLDHLCRLRQAARRAAARRSADGSALT
ncbi:hypothetical protein STENM327S_05262 [Streptomyces tendae]